jgi:hypothetical protein
MASAATANLSREAKHLKGAKHRQPATDTVTIGGAATAAHCRFYTIL